MITLFAWLGWGVVALMVMRFIFPRILGSVVTYGTPDTADKIVGTMVSVCIGAFWPVALVLGGLFLWVTAGNKTEKEKQAELREKERELVYKIAALEHELRSPPHG